MHFFGIRVRAFSSSAKNRVVVHFQLAILHASVFGFRFSEASPTGKPHHTLRLRQQSFISCSVCPLLRDLCSTLVFLKVNHNAEFISDGFNLDFRGHI